MRKMVTVRAQGEFSYHGEIIRPGARVEMTPIDAAVAARAGRISLTRDLPVESPAAPRKKRRTYKRRDLIPEP